MTFEEQKAEKAPSLILRELGFTALQFQDDEAEPNTFDTVRNEKTGQVSIIAYDQHKAEWSLATDKTVEEAEEMMRSHGFKDAPSVYSPKPEDKIQ